MTVEFSAMKWAVAWPVTWALAMAWACPAAAELPVEHITMAKMPPDNGHRLYVADYALAHGVDAKIHVMDGDTFRILGQLSNGSFGVFTVAADGKTLFNATSFYSRGDHGVRTEVLEFYDPQSLLPTGEVILPLSRAQSNGVNALMAESAGGKFLFVQDATPATSVTIVDLTGRKLLTTIPTAGCYGIYPSALEAGRFSALCGDGSVLTVGIDATGHETARRRSAVLFDPVADPLFLNGIPDGKSTLFLTFLGNVHDIDMSGEVATQAAPWSITASVPRSEGWRPGGVQPFAYAASTGSLYVGMHPNGHEGSHKEGAKEIWKVDMARRTVVARHAAESAISLQVSREAVPVLFAVNGDAGTITRYDGDTLQPLGESKHILEFAGPISVQ
jgi:methylamine dehydrogenase heavy chain